MTLRQTYKTRDSLDDLKAAIAASHYTIVSHHNADNLVAAVADRMGEGYHPLGGVTWANGEYHQAMLWRED